MENTIAQRLKEVRKKENLTQLEFAEQIGISRSLAAGIEREAKEINAHILKALKEKYNISADWLLFGEQTPKANIEDLFFIYENAKDKYDEVSHYMGCFDNMASEYMFEVKNDLIDSVDVKLYKKCYDWYSEIKEIETKADKLSSLIISGTIGTLPKNKNASLLDVENEIREYYKYCNLFYEKISQFVGKNELKFTLEIAHDSWSAYANR